MIKAEQALYFYNVRSIYVNHAVFPIYDCHRSLYTVPTQVEQNFHKLYEMYANEPGN